MTVRDFKPAPKPVDWKALQYQPANAVLLACHCGARYIDDEPSRAAHNVVFGHWPARPNP